MDLRLLKSLRVIVSIIFITAISLSFLDFRNFMPAGIINVFTFLQFVPSMLKLSLGFAVILFLTLIFGRVYCSTVCPLGVFQDCLARIRRVRHGYRKPDNKLRYGLLAFTAGVFLAGSSLALYLLDPFSIFGRIFSDIFRPGLIWLNNRTAVILESEGIFSLYRVQWGEPVYLSIAVSLIMLAVIMWLSVNKGRLYCNTICPVGTFLGLISKVSFYKIDIQSHTCAGCGECETVCKSDCIDSAAKTVDMSRCVCCFNCFSACDSGGLHYLTAREKKRKPVEKSRRKFLINSALFTTAVLPGAEIPVKEVRQSRPTTVPVVLTSEISPPGSKSIADFTTRCTACHLCVSACPTRVLVPSTVEFGLHGLLQPHMGYKRGHCNYECTVCIDICPTGAIQPVSTEEKKLIQIGIAKFIKDNCVVHTDKTACGACSEHCPTKAVKMVPYKNDVNDKLTIPEMHKEICIGCGGCEYACPTKPFKAIYVDGSPVHKKAEKPKIEKLEPLDIPEDFPF